MCLAEEFVVQLKRGEKSAEQAMAWFESLALRATATDIRRTDNIGHSSLSKHTSPTKGLNAEPVRFGDGAMMARAERIFHKLDQDGDGFITHTELISFFRIQTGESEATASISADNLLGLSGARDRLKRISLTEFIHTIMVCNRNLFRV